MMRKAMAVLKWILMALGVALIGFGASVSLGNEQAIQLAAPVSAAVLPAEEAADPFDPYLISVSEALEPADTSLPDAYNTSVSRLAEIDGGKQLEAPLQPERLIIPSIELDAPVKVTGEKTYRINGTIYRQWIVPDEFAVGWNPASGSPNLNGNTVLFGHHNVNGAVFANLVNIEPGALITVEAGGRQFYYKVKEVLRVQEKDVPFAEMLANATYVSRTADKRLTLITCWPPYNSTHRLIVIAKPVNAPEPTPIPLGAME